MIYKRVLIKYETDDVVNYNMVILSGCNMSEVYTKLNNIMFEIDDYKILNVEDITEGEYCLVTLLDKDDTRLLADKKEGFKHE